MSGDSQCSDHGISETSKGATCCCGLAASVKVEYMNLHIHKSKAAKLVIQQSLALQRQDKSRVHGKV